MHAQTYTRARARARYDIMVLFCKAKARICETQIDEIHLFNAHS